MNKIVYRDIEGLVENIFEAWNCVDDQEVCIVGFYEDICDVLNELVMYDEFYMVNIELHDPLMEGYEKEFVIEIGTDGDVWVEKASHDDGKSYVSVGGSNDVPVIFIFSNVNSKFIAANEEASFFEIEQCDGNCDECEFGDDDVDFSDMIDEIAFEDEFDDGMHGYSWTRNDENGYIHESFYASDPEFAKLWIEKLK